MPEITVAVAHHSGYRLTERQAKAVAAGTERTAARLGRRVAEHARPRAGRQVAAR